MQLSGKGVAAALTVASVQMLSLDAVAQEQLTGQSLSGKSNSEKDVDSTGLDWLPDWIAKPLAPWRFDGAILWYREQDRVQAIEGIVQGRYDYSDSLSVTAKMLLDSLSGASATGALPQPTAQTFTRPSGGGEYNIAAGQTPLDDTFKDTRLQLSADWSEIISTEKRIHGGVYGSKEFDYASLGVNGGAEWGFNKDNTTLSLSMALGMDVVDPVGAVPVAGAPMAIRKDFSGEDTFLAAFATTRIPGVRRKYTSELLFGLNQVINRSTLVQLNYGVALSQGYLTDPYKILSVVNEQGLAQEYRYESRPDSRLRHSLFALLKHAMDKGIWDASYRFTLDDWGMQSHTLETRLRRQFGDIWGFKGLYGQLHLRWLHQGETDFYRSFLMEGEALPRYMSADYRLGDMDTYTLGVKLGYRLSGGRELAWRLGWYHQVPRGSQPALPALAGLDLYPVVDAAMLQLNYQW
ncbi:DUF3570 domain-containing protein [Shewanella sedimentimangrovi]|uniref:DUF3570 domain-containing protein n=1 Tax=Shewanella sedimentimangrovi TaxID=2814293 RepID=A0ABX7QVT5_9GAMM|nr:DUF3570 domain-containing protein [Shewanella sedimentimangrovi]QSX35626.1 DUF3570 domain-containing protein [Shewanella sedimentimangrovi]